MNARERNEAAKARAKANPEAVAEAARTSNELAQALRQWPMIECEYDPKPDAPRISTPFGDAAQPTEDDIERAETAWREAEANQTAEWRASHIRALLMQRAAPPEQLKALSEHGFTYDSIANARDICKHLAALPCAPDAKDGLSLLSLVVEAIPDEVEWDGRSTAIVGGDLFAWTNDGAPTVITRRHDNDMGLELGEIRPDEQLCLFGMEPSDSEIMSPSAIVLANAVGFGGLVPGRGARLDKRIFTFALLRIPQDMRRPGGRYTWRPTLREMVHWLLFPAPADTGTGESTRSMWKPARHAPTLARALDAVTLASVVLPDRRHWRAVMVRAMPDFYDLNSRLVIDMRLPDESDHGPLIQLHSLIAAGVVSDPAFDGELTLAAVWDRAKARNGGQRIYATRPKAMRDKQGRLTDAAGNLIVGPDPVLSWENRRKVPRDKPARDWSDSRAMIVGEERHPQANRVPLLNRDDRRRLFYGRSSDHLDRRARSKAADRAEVRLRTLESRGQVVIDVEPEGWRILEPRPQRTEVKKR